jgi:hypothetical protein
MHQVRVRDKTEGTTAAVLLEIGHEFGINDPRALLTKVRAAVSRVAEFAEPMRVPAAALAQLRSALRQRDAELGAG